LWFKQPAIVYQLLIGKKEMNTKGKNKRNKEKNN